MLCKHFSELNSLNDGVGRWQDSENFPSPIFYILTSRCNYYSPERICVSDLLVL